MPSGATEAPREGFSDESNNIPPSNSTPAEAEKEPEISSQNESNSEPEKASKPETEILESKPKPEISKPVGFGM
ncbi:MAG: hypothetical protein UU10_C0037G0005 [Parcubacteria group bacterium GW2011_GWF1_40_6]|nr:MAG: hypothetical protein UU10_C0037G0005 [Parcubacteria group bacterium GW2011_GWF1_40_6]